MTPTDPRPEPVPDDGSAPASEPAQPVPPVQPAGLVRPEQAREDTDAAWGEYPERDEDRLYRDRPPHWADF